MARIRIVLEKEEAVALVREHGGSVKAAAEAADMPRTSFRRLLGLINRDGSPTGTTADDLLKLYADLPPSADPEIGDLLEFRKRQFERKRAHEDGRVAIPVHVYDDKPIGILHMGDPHIDDDGTDITRIEADMKLVRETDGLFAGNIGDTTNNWIGRLGRLFGQQSTSSRHATMLARWLIDGLEGSWLYIIGGNHDCWSGEGDIIAWMVEQQSNVPRLDFEARLALTFDNGAEIRINAHHDFVGHSMWNPAHGSMKAAQFGFRDHILISGHTHCSGYGLVKDPLTGLISHCIQVATYKVFDRHKRERGFRDQNISPSVVTILDPRAEVDGNAVGVVTVYHDVNRGAQVLKMLRDAA